MNLTSYYTIYTYYQLITTLTIQEPVAYFFEVAMGDADEVFRLGPDSSRDEGWKDTDQSFVFGDLGEADSSLLLGILNGAPDEN